MRRVATAETGNRVPLGPPKSRYLYRTKNLYMNRQEKSKIALKKAFTAELKLALLDKKNVASGKKENLKC